MALPPNFAEKASNFDPEEFLSEVISMLKKLQTRICNDVDPVKPKSPPTLEEFIKNNDNRFFRGKLLVMTYKAFVPESSQDLEKANALGWVIEIVHSACLLTGNMTIMHNNLPTVNMTAVNGYFAASSFAFKVLKEHFKDRPYYQELYHQLVDVIDLTSKGITLDCLIGMTSDDILKRYTLDRYNTLARYKNNYYTFYAPVALGIIFAGKSNDLTLMANIKQLTLKIGHYFQVRDDYLNCFGGPEKTGKVGTAIEGNRLTWLFVKAVQLANSKQLQELANTYGKWDKECVEKVRNVYVNVGVKEEFEHFEGYILEEIKDMAVELENLSANGCLAAALFFNLFEKMHMTDV